jgi:ankyrin repeat protein
MTVVEMLLEAKADVYIKDGLGRTALDCAILAGNQKLVMILSEVMDKQKQEVESTRNPTG